MVEMVDRRALPQRAGARRAVMWLLKWILLTIVLIVSASVFFSLVGHSGKSVPQEGPLTMTQAILAVNGAVAAVLGLLAAQARISPLRLGLFLFVVLFGVQTAMMQIETIYYIDASKIALIDVGRLTLQQALTAAVTAVVGALLFRPEAVGPEPLPNRLVPRLVLLTIVYIVLYYGAGAFIAWQSADVRAFYDNGIRIEPWSQLALQLVRGLLWAILSLYVVLRLNGSVLARAVILAVMFAVLTDMQLLYPNADFPWAVRRVHLVEVGVSEAAYGALAALILLAGSARKRLAATQS